MEIIKYPSTPSIQNRGTKCSFVFCPLWSGVGLVSIETQVSLVPRPSQVGGEAWYTLFVHGTHCLCMHVIKMEIYYIMTKLTHTGGPGKSYDIYV